MPNKNNKFITINEAAKILGVAKKTLRRWESRGILIPARTSGGHRRYLLVKVENFKRIKKKRRVIKPLIKEVQKPPAIERIPAVKTLPAKLQIQPKKTITDRVIRTTKKLPVHKDYDLASIMNQIYKSVPKSYKSIVRVSLTIFFILLSTAFLGSKGPFENLRLAQDIQEKLSSISLFKPAPKETGIEKLKSDIANGQISPTVLAATSFNNVTFKVNVESFFANDANFKGNIAANGGNITTIATEANLFNEVAETLNLGGSATAINIGATTGTTSINNILNVAGGSITSPGDLLIDPTGEDATVDGNLILSDTFTLQVGGKTGIAYNAFANSADAPEQSVINSDNDLYIGGDLEIDGTIYGNGSGLSSVDADKLDSFDSTSFLRSDTSDSFTSGTLDFNDGTFLDLSEIVYDDTAPQGIRLPQAVSFTSPSSGEGYVAWDTDDDIMRVYDGSSWSAVGLFTDSGTITYLTSATDDFALGGSTSSAPFFFDESAEQLILTNTTSGLSFRVNDASGDSSPFVIGASGNVGIGTTTPNEALDLQGRAYISDTTAPSTTTNRLYAVSGNLLWNGTQLNSGPSSAPWTEASGVVYLATSTSNVTVGSTGNLAKLGIDGDTNEIQLLVQSNATQTSNLAVFEQSDGTNVFTVDNSGNLAIEGQLSDLSGATLAINDGVSVAGDLAVNGATSADITSTTATATVFDTTVTSLSLGSAATTLNIADAAITGTIDIGGVTADGATTVNIATNSTSADTLSIGNSNASTTLALTGGDDWNISGTGAANFVSIGATTAGTGAFTTLSVAPASTNDITFTTDADSTFVLSGLQASTGSALCVDGSNNVVTCTVGSGGISGS
ncbi:MerR family DNA-binding transcriptional regulator, partial [Patescibacteria group bacterium]|nr:MerR family DNA-binding transcriptional regulator [Patescibacteria group bacterium]